MNHLALIQQKLKKQHKVESYNKSVAYRGNRYEIGKRNPETTHGSYCYRGSCYTK